MGGFQLMVADDVLRGKFRDGFTEPKPIEPGVGRGATSSTCAPATTASAAATGSWCRCRAAGSR